MWQSKADASASPPRWSLPELCTLCTKILARSALYPDSKVVCPNRQMKVQRREFSGPRSRVSPLRASLGRCRGLVRCTPACLPERQTLCKAVSPPLLPAPLPHLMPSRELCAQPRGSDSQLPSPSRSPGSEKPPYRLYTLQLFPVWPSDLGQRVAGLRT